MSKHCCIDMDKAIDKSYIMFSSEGYALLKVYEEEHQHLGNDWDELPISYCPFCKKDFRPLGTWSQDKDGNIHFSKDVFP